MRISDWSSDVCSSDLVDDRVGARERPLQRADALVVGQVGADPLDLVAARGDRRGPACDADELVPADRQSAQQGRADERKRVGQGKSGAGRLALGGRLCSKKKKRKESKTNRIHI